MREELKKCLVVLGAVASLVAPAGASHIDDPPDLAGMATRAGGGPIDLPPDTDTFFTVDQGPGLDTGCTFRSGGPLIIDIPVTRYAGETYKSGRLSNLGTLKRKGMVRRFARLYLPAYDVDYDPEDLPPGVAAERDLVWFNYKPINKLNRGLAPFLHGTSGTWSMNIYEIPIEYVKFPSSPGFGGPPTPVLNRVRIDIDVANTNEYWCTAVDWAALEVGVMSPVILVHGINSDPGFFERQKFTEGLDAQDIVWNRKWHADTPQEYDQRIFMESGKLSEENPNLRRLGRRSFNASVLASRIPVIAEEFGVDSVHIVAHSKGGLDVRDYLVNYYPKPSQQCRIVSFTTLATPHNGSVLANAAINRYYGLTQAASIEWPDFPSYTESVASQIAVLSGHSDLTTWSTAAFNAATLWRLPKDIVYNTVTGDADFDGSGGIDSVAEIAALRVESPELANMSDWKAKLAVNVVYQILKKTRTARLEYSYSIVLIGLYWKTVKIGVMVGIPTEEDTLNDTLVTEPSGRGVGSFQEKVVASQGSEWYEWLKVNHASVGGRYIADEDDWYSGAGVSKWIVQAERNNGDLAVE